MDFIHLYHLEVSKLSRLPFPRPVVIADNAPNLTLVGGGTLSTFFSDLPILLATENTLSSELILKHKLLLKHYLAEGKICPAAERKYCSAEVLVLYKYAWRCLWVHDP